MTEYIMHDSLCEIIRIGLYEADGNPCYCICEDIAEIRADEREKMAQMLEEMQAKAGHGGWYYRSGVSAIRSIKSVSRGGK